MLQQRIVVEHTHNPRMFSQTLLQIPNHAPQPRFRKRIEKIKDRWLERKRELSRIRADRFQREALLRFASILAQILLRSLMQRRQKLHAHDAAKGIVRSHQQRASFAGAQIDKDEVVKVRVASLTQSVEHFVEQCGLGWLVRRVESAEQAIAPTNSRTGRVDAMLPIKVSIAVALATAFRSRVANDFPQRCEKLPRRLAAAFARGDILPPLR